MPILLEVCPWDLLIVMANANFIGNCLLLIWHGRFDSWDVSVILGIRTTLLAEAPLIGVADITFGERSTTINLKKYHNLNASLILN
jgi:hypothetical protein